MNGIQICLLPVHYGLDTEVGYRARCELGDRKSYDVQFPATLIWPNFRHFFRKFDSVGAWNK